MLKYGTELIAYHIFKNHPPSRAKSKLYFIAVGILFGFLSTIIAVISFANRYDVSMDILLSSDSASFYVFGALSSIIASWIFYVFNKYSIKFRDETRKHNEEMNAIIQESKWKFIKKVIYYLVKIRHIIKIAFFSLVIGIILTLILIIFARPSHLGVSLYIELFLIPVTIAIILGILLLLTRWFGDKTKKITRFSESYTFYLIYTIQIAFISSYVSWFALKKSHSEDQFFFGFVFFTLILVLSYLLLFTHNPKKLTLMRYNQGMAIVIGLFLMTILVIMTRIGFLITGITPLRSIEIMSIHSNAIKTNQTLILDRVDYFVAHDATKNISLVYQKDRFEWQPTEIEIKNEKK